MRPPTEDNGATATVIARVLPEYRRRGLGTQLYERSADQHGFVELERCLLREGDTVPWIDLRLTSGHEGQDVG